MLFVSRELAAVTVQKLTVSIVMERKLGGSGFIDTNDFTVTSRHSRTPQMVALTVQWFERSKCSKWWCTCIIAHSQRHTTFRQ